jgi:hypothetical protein
MNLLNVSKNIHQSSIGNEVSEGKGIRFSKEASSSSEVVKIESFLPKAMNAANDAVNEMDVPFKLSDVELLAVLCPTF